MAKIKSFRDLDARKKVQELRLIAMKEIKDFPPEYKYGISSQLQRSFISVGSNIVESFGRISDKEKLQFYSITEGLLTEVIDQLIVSKDLGLIGEKTYTKAQSLAQHSHKFLHGLMRYPKTKLCI